MKKENETKDLKLWVRIKSRCNNPKNISFKNYGGRGIRLYPEWINNPNKFLSYIQSLDMYRFENYSLDRIDNDGNYEPGNLRWASKSTQAINKRIGKNNKTGYVGLSQYKGKYRSRITKNHKTYHLGWFGTINEGIAERNSFIKDQDMEHKIQTIL